MNNSMTRRNTGSKIPLGVKMAYSGVEWSTSFWFTLYAVFFLIFMTDIVGISPFIAGMILSVAVLWDAITDPIMGIISDRTRSRFGRRRPYLLAVAAPFGIILWFSFSVPPLEGGLLVAYYIVMTILIHTAYTIANVPYTALASEMTRDYDQRTSLATYIVLGGNIGALVAATATPVLVELFKDPKVGWSTISAVYGIICIFPILITWRGTRGWELYTEEPEPFSFRDIFKAITGNRVFRYILGIYFFGISAIYAVSSLWMYFLQYCLQMDENQISIYFFLVFVFMVLLVPAINYVASRLGKRTAYMIYMGIFAFSLAFLPMILQPGKNIYIYLFAIPSAIGAVTIYQLCWAMIPDVVEVEEYKTGIRREGLYFGVCAFVMKLGSAVALLIVGMSLEWVGYMPNEIQTAGTILGIRILTGPVTAALTLFSIVVCFFMPMTREKHNSLCEALDCKKEGKEFDTSCISDIIC